MSKPLLLYSPIYDYVAELFVDKMNDIPAEEDIEVWMNCPGGRVFAGWSMIGPTVKRTGKKKMCVFGHAASMAVFFMLYMDEVEALEVTRFLIHRADGYVETPEDQAFLDSINKDLRKQMESRLNMDVFEEVCGCTMDDIFNPNGRKEVWLDAKQAKKLGLIQSIKKFTKKESEAYNEHFVAFADFSHGSEKPQRSEATSQNDSPNNKPKINKMTKEELQAQHPDVYAAIHSSGHAAGVKAERDRVNAHLAFIDADKENVIKAVKEGAEFSQATIAEMTAKMIAASKVTNLNADGSGTPPAATPPASGKTEAEKELEAFEKSVNDGAKKINLF